MREKNKNEITSTRTMGGITRKTTKKGGERNKQ